MNFELQDFFARSEYSLRKADDADIDELVTIINDAYSYQDDARGESRTNYNHLEKRISETDFYVIEYHYRIVGCVYIEAAMSSMHFGLLTLVPEHRGKGVASQVMDAIEAMALTNKFESIELEYMSVAPWLKAYYERYGFSVTGEIENWGEIQLIRMKKKL